jgi:hypothetical protein
MRKFALAIIIVLTGFIHNYDHNIAVFAAEKKPGHAMPVSEAVPDTTDVHYTDKYCMVCHEQTPRQGVKSLKYGGDFKQLCRCHYKTIERDLHPIGIEPSEEKKKRLPNDFPLQDGKIDCITCHDIFDQCRDSGSAEMFADESRLFLRGKPYKNLKTLCYKCHNEIQFKKYNPHKQLNANGDIVGLKCLYCHKKIPDVNQAGYDDITLIGNLDMLCDRCHNKIGEQSLHASHMRKPSAKVLARIKQLENKFGIILPLNDDGKITCVTCHNPHEKGVIPAEKAGSKGADEAKRHRFLENICMQCHQMG